MDAAKVYWTPSASADYHKVVCADYDRRVVGYLQVDPSADEESSALASVQFPNLNLQGKYRVDVLAINAAGASEPKTLYFDARAAGSQNSLTPKEVELLFQSVGSLTSNFEVQERKQKVRPKGRKARGPGQQKRHSLMDGQRQVEQFEGKAVYNYVDKNESPDRHSKSGSNAEDSVKAKKVSVHTERHLRGPFAKHEVVEKEKDEAQPTRKDVSKPGKGKFREEQKEKAQKEKAKETQRQREEREEQEAIELLSPVRTEMLTKAIVANDLKEAPTFRHPFDDWTALVSPEVPVVHPRQAVRTTHHADGALQKVAQPLKLEAEVKEDACQLRWWWEGKGLPGFTPQGKPQAINKYTIFGAPLGERWKVFGRLQYGETSFTARRLPRGLTYAFVLFATPIGTFDEGWASGVQTVVVEAGQPEPPTDVSLHVEEGMVLCSWTPPKPATGSEEIACFRVRSEEPVGKLLTEVPPACTCVSWPFARYQAVGGTAALTVAAVSTHGRESARVASHQGSEGGPEEARTGPPRTPTLELAKSGGGEGEVYGVAVHWESTDPLLRYTILLRRRGHEQIRRIPVDRVSPVTVKLSPGVDVAAALEADSQANGPLVSGWSEPISIRARVPSAPGKPMVRQSREHLQLSWPCPENLHGSVAENLSYLVLMESEDGRRVEVQAGKNAHWSVKVDDLMEHFYHNRIRFAAVAVTPAGRSPVGPFSTKFVIQPSGAWAVKYHRRVGPIEARPAGHHTGPHSSLVAEVNPSFNTTAKRMGTGGVEPPVSARLKSSGRMKDPELAYSTRERKFSPAFLASATRTGEGKDWISYYRSLSRSPSRAKEIQKNRERSESPQLRPTPRQIIASFPPRPF